jgi:hypothetical protein
MQKLKSVLVFTVVAFLCPIGYLYAQNTSLSGDGMGDFIRRSQLLGTVSLQQGLTARSFETNLRAIDSLSGWKARWNIKTSGSTKVEILPFTVVGQTNSHHPYGSNDGGMIPASGLQGAVAGGIAIRSGKFSLQLRPEIVYASNDVFETFHTDDPYWVEYYRWLNIADIPERFGTSSYKKIFPGQSALRYNTGNISLGISTENMWWGPGIRNALIMSNNAPGFLHATINTTTPIKTGIGLFEGQLIGGQLTASGIFPPERNRYNTNSQLLYIPKRDESRYIAGMVLSWQPKWVKGLFIGFAKASYLYQSDVSGIADILPLEGIIRSSSEKNHKKAAIGSLFGRFVMPEEKAELYIEYGRNDKSPNLVNLVADEGYPRAYVAGLRKLFSLKPGTFLEIASEFTQMQLPTGILTFSGRSWYTDTFVRQGYTQQGQVLGASVGPGGNSQMIDISWVRGFNKVGLMFERFVHNNDYYYNAFANVRDFTRHWTDLSTTAHIDWQYKQLLISSQLALIRSLNYEWFTFPAPTYFNNGYDVLNFHARLSISYRL